MYRARRAESRIQQMLWKINYSDIVFVNTVCVSTSLLASDTVVAWFWFAMMLLSVRNDFFISAFRTSWFLEIIDSVKFPFILRLLLRFLYQNVVSRIKQHTAPSSAVPRGYLFRIWIIDCSCIMDMYRVRQNNPLRKLEFLENDHAHFAVFFIS